MQCAPSGIALPQSAGDVSGKAGPYCGITNYQATGNSLGVLPYVAFCRPDVVGIAA